MLQLLQAMMGGPVYTLSGESISDTAGNTRQVQALVRIDADGNVYQVVNGVSTQIDTGTDWVRPTDANSGGQHWARATLGIGADTLDVGSAGSWLQVNADRSFGYQHSLDDTEHSGTITVEIATDSGGTNIVASGDYPLEAIRGLPT